jgi:hypothetical protein
MSNNQEALLYISHPSFAFSIPIMFSWLGYNMLKLILSDVNKHVLCFVEIHSKKTYKHAHLQTFQKQCITYGFDNQGKWELTCTLQLLMILYLNFQANNIVLPFQEEWFIGSRA